MFTPNKIKFTDETISYLSNINHLAKDIKKLFTFLSNRERTIFEQLDNIKHNQLLHYISQSYGFDSYRDFDSNKIYFDVSTLETLQIRITKEIKESTNIKDEFIDEVFDLFYLNVSSSRKDTLKSAAMKKIKSRLQKIKDFRSLDIYPYSERKRKKDEKLLVETLRKKISGEQCERIESLIFQFLERFEFYEKIINKKYSYVWYPYSFERLFSITKIEEEKDILEKVNLYSPFKEILSLIPEWIICANLYKYHTSTSIEETYYIQSEKENRYVEQILVVGEISMSYHGGLYMFGNNGYLNDLKSKHLRGKNNCIHLKKITWDKHDPFNITIHSYEKDFFALMDIDGILIDTNASNDARNEKDFKIISLEYPIIDVIGFSIFKGKSYDVVDMKPFYMFKTKEDTLEYQFIYGKNIVYSLKFGINKIIIVSPNKRLEMTYDELFKITDENKYMYI